MKESKIDIMLHPIRMRTIQTLIGGRRLTVQQINELLPDVPQATMYRHLNKLLEAGIITVVEENQVRGTVEKVYSLAEHVEHLTKEDIDNATREDHFRYFFTFLTNLLGDFEKYLSQDKFDLISDGVGYRLATVYLNDEEFVQLQRTIADALQKVAHNEPAPGRKPRNIATIVLPQLCNPSKKENE